MSSRVMRKAASSALAATMVLGGAILLPATAASAAPPVTLPGDIGVYTNGQNHVTEIGSPTYTNVAEVAGKLAPGVPYTADNMYQSIFAKDLAAGGTDYYLDRVLGVTGAQGSAVLQTRGRTVYMRGASNTNFTAMGFAGATFAGGPNSLGNFYTVTVPGQTVAEVPANRFNAPSHASTRYTVGTTGVVADQKKFITHENVAVTALTFSNPGTEARTFTVRAAAPIATAAVAGTTDELTGTRTLSSGSNNGTRDTPWTTVKIGLKAKGFTAVGANLDREVTVPAGGTVSLSVVGALSTDTLTDTIDSFHDYADLAPADAVRTGVTAFNERWAADIPYISVPDPAIEKAIVYRWWGERYNVLDANEPGHVYQYPTTIEGVNLYQNSIVLTQPMHLQDTKWIRTPYLPYGQILNVGELSGSSAFLDSPGHTSWNNHYSQYIGTAGLEAFNVHGGGAEVAERFAYYFEKDGQGQLEHYDGNDDNLIAYDTNYMPGNDSDAISFGFPRTGGTRGNATIERPESAYVWGAYDAAAQLYDLAGADPAKVAALDEKADDIKESILTNLWSPEMKMFLARTSHGAQAAAASGTGANPLTDRNFVPAKETNLYDVYAENLIDPEDAETYVDGFRFLTYGDNFPIFPFYTANQYDRAKFGIGGSNNFSNINFTVQYRGVRTALRTYDTAEKYITPAYAKQLLDWMAWSIYPGGDLRVPNQAEYYSNWNAANKTYNRNNPNHIMLGNMNYIFVEDMAGILPRSDDKIELSPIDLGYDHFMVNNLRYHGQDLTIVWDRTGTKYGLGTGYMLFVNGEKKVTADKIGKLVYDPNAHTVSDIEAGVTTTLSGAAEDFPTAIDTPIEDDRVVEYLKTAGIDMTEDAPNLAADATLSSSFTQVGARPAPWREFHTPGLSSSMNHVPGAITELERPVALSAVTDGVTVNEPYWGNFGTTDPNGYVELDLGAAKDFDNLKVFFVSDRQAGGYSEPLRYTVQVQNGEGAWVPVEGQARSPKVPSAKFNEVLFDTQTASKVRLAFVNKPTRFTAISEIQLFDSGRDVPVVVNEAPAVTVAVDATRNGNLSTNLVATVVDDGLPETGALSYGWEVVSRPAGAGVIFSTPNALTTTVTGTVEGAYTLRFRASDGALTTNRDITVTLVPKVMVAEFGASATISTSGTASWENDKVVNGPTTPTSSTNAPGWGTWGQPQNGTSAATAAWIKYTWASPVLLTSTDIYWYDDNGGTRTPRADTYVVEYTTDGTTWTPVTLTGGSTYAAALNRNQFNKLTFAPVNAKELRIRITGVQTGGAGTGVLRWRANGDTVESVTNSPVLIRTVTGTIPTLPTSLDVVYSQGTTGSAEFVWEPITAAQVAEANVEPFVVYGTNAAYGLLAEARIYVRPQMGDSGISIQGAQQFTRSVAVGQVPTLPTKVEVSFNDGSRDNQAVGVNWNFDPAVVNTEGRYVITGDLVLPSYISSAGTRTTILTLTVGNPPAASVTSVAVTPATATVTTGETRQFAADVVVVGGADKTVTWSLTGAASAGTTVSSTGLLTVAADESAATVTVTATSVVDGTKKGSATVTVDQAATDLAFTIDAQSRCLAGKGIVLVKVTNDEAFAVTYTVSTAHGEKNVGSLAAGRTVSYSVTLKSATVPAGTATVTAVGPDGQTVRTASIPARTC